MFKKMRTLVILVFIAYCWGQDWQPFLHQNPLGKESYHQSLTNLLAHQYQPALSIQSNGGQCDLFKVGFTQDLYFQYIQYKVEMPELKEFTLCFWNKFTNHSNDHPIFSYAVDGQPRAIYSWVSNTDRASYYSMSVEGHTFYRLNYPLRLNRWYHTCQSWNGKTGEWQVWVNAERVGRGFHNRLVGHKILSGGIALTGQEQSQIGGGFLEGHEAPKGAGGMLGEITMMQLYKVALTAGKAHKDHKHHHVHKYDHNGAEITTTPAPSTTPRIPQPTHPLLTGGQINSGAALNIAAQQSPQIVPGQQFNAQYFNGQFSPGLVSRQLQAAVQQNAPTNNPQQALQFVQVPQLSQVSQSAQIPQVPANDVMSYSQQTISFGGRPLVNSGLIQTSSGVQFIDGLADYNHNLYKRQNKDENNISKVKRETKDGKKPVEKTKRELVLAGGHLVDDSIFTGIYDQSLLSGLAGIGQNEPVLQQQMKMEEREPAEAEVQAVMNVCSGCDPEPFEKALVFGWRNVAKKLYSGAIYTPAINECRVF